MDVLRLAGVRFDARDVDRVAAFWAELLGWDVEEGPAGRLVVVPTEPGSYPVVVTPNDSPKVGQNRIHLDLPSASAEAMRERVGRACALGGGPVDIGQAPDEPHTVLADPEGNEFCVIPPGNRFLADTATVGAVNCDGTRALGLFWSAALGWPLVWDRDEETAIQSPEGGSKVTWSGPPLMPRRGRDRVRLEITTTGPREAAVERLCSSGAVLADGSDPGEVLLLDPDGNEFHLVTSP